jgi:hypothetical protein
MSSLRRDNRPRGLSLQQSEDRLQRHGSRTVKKAAGPEDAYLYALGTAFLTYLLQPRQKRLQHVAGPAAPKTVHRSSAIELLTDPSGMHNSRGNKFPHEFMKALDLRASGVLIGRERMPEFNDPLLKRTFGVFLNNFKDPNKRRNLEKDRKMEDLLLFFYSSSVGELKKQKDADDDSWKFMADRHLAMFVRLISAIMKDKDWAKEKPELSARLQTLEKKLLLHDLNLATNTSRNGGAGGQTIEVEVPLSYDVKDMPAVLMVSRIFDRSHAQVQNDINQNKAAWTELAALKDLKMYQQSVSLKARNTINLEDFDTEEAYEAWKKKENHEVSQMMFAIMQTHPELAKASTTAAIPQIQGISSPSGSAFAELSRKLSEQSDSQSALSLDHSFDFSALNISSEGSQESADIPFVFIPKQPRTCYRLLVKQTLLHDIRNPDEADTVPEGHLLARKSSELLEDVASRWRIPSFSRRILFLEAVKELYLERDIGLPSVDTALNQFNDVSKDKKKANRQSSAVQDLVAHWTSWMLKDVTTYQQSLSAIRDNVLRDLFHILQGAYEAKSPPFGTCMMILHAYLLDDELLSRNPKELNDFAQGLTTALKERAAETYQDVLAKNVPSDASEWEFYNVIQLGKDVVKLCDKIQKRFKKAANIFGAQPLPILAAEILPSFAVDARDMIKRIMDNAKQSGEEVPMQDGFDLYRELVEIRSVYTSALPGQPFAFEVEDHLQDFVWRWIRNTEESMVGWVEGAVKQDNFQMGTHPGASDHDERHSVSVVDTFRSFKQSKDQIVELNWDNEYQNAKFMNAMARAVGLGVAKYCELLDQQFTREMSRLTPEQEAQLSRTRQEKWVQLARDAFNGKDKVEPYQFSSEVGQGRGEG